MHLELFGRIHKELSITGAAVYEIVLSISERVNRKVQIMRLHWHASALLRQIDQVSAQLGQQMVEHMPPRFLIQGQQEAALDASLSQAALRVHDLKDALMQVDAKIRELKIEAIHEDLIRLQQDLSIRSARIERIAIARNAAAVGESMGAMPQSSSVHIASVFRGPFLLAPSEDLLFRPDDIVVLIGLESDLDRLVTWFTSQRPLKAPTTKSA